MVTSFHRWISSTYKSTWTSLGNLFHGKLPSRITNLLQTLGLLNIQTHFPQLYIQSVQSLSLVWLFVTPWIAACQALPVHHKLPEFTQTHVHRVCDAIQPSHPLSSPSPPAPNPSQHQGLFKWVNSSHEVVKVLEFQFQHQSFQWTPRISLL